MADVPYPITSRDPAQAISQMKLLIDELFQERIAGLNIGDVFQGGEDDVLTLTLSATGGLEKTDSSLTVKVDTAGGLKLSADGVGIKVRANYGLTADANGLAIIVRANYGITLDSNGLALKKGTHEADAAAVSAVT